MDVCIYGAGAVGTFIGVLMARQGHAVTLIGRGPHLEAMRKDRARLEMGGEVLTAHPACAADPDGLGEQDVIIVSVKAPALPSVIPRLGGLLAPHTSVVPAMNGIPWWFFHGLASAPEEPLRSVDPGGVLSASLPIAHVVGCVVHVGCTVVEPGLVRHAADNRLIIGEPDGHDSTRCQALAAAFSAAGIATTVSGEIQQEVWLKLLGNFNFGPISVLTGATNAEIAGDPDLRRACVLTAEEAIRVGEAYGLRPGMSIDERIDLGGSLGAFRTSMWQDFEHRRPPEIDAIVGAVVEMGQHAGVATPNVDMLLALVAAKARLAGLYG